MRRALIVGIDEYSKAPLNGCVNDAIAISRLLSRHEDGAPNFDCLVITAPPQQVSRVSLRQNLEALFDHKADVAVFYFSGHGIANGLGGFLVTQDAKHYDEGVAMSDILRLAHAARRIEEIVILLDCCNSGAFGSAPVLGGDAAVLREGLSVLTASHVHELATESGGRGIFTQLIEDALKGGASDVLGRTTVASVYAFVDQALGAWRQRPLFKSNISSLISLRNCKPIVPVDLLRKLPSYFPAEDSDLQLDPSFEKDLNAVSGIADGTHPSKEEIFRHLQRFRDARLLAPVGEEHLYYAAINRKACRLTLLGRFYWRLAKEGKI